MSAFVDMLMRIKDRAEREWDTRADDTIPNPVAGLGLGPEELHYNPLSDKPLIGGLINTTVNGGLHTAGLVTEGAGEVAKALAGYALLAGAKVDEISGDAPEAQRAVGQRILEAGLAHPGRATDIARTGEDSGTAYLGGALEMLLNPMNFANGIGAAGSKLAEADGLLGAAGKGIQGIGMGLEAGNRASMLPLAGLPRVGRSLTELPEYLRPANAEQIAPLLRAVQESAGTAPTRATRLGDLAESGLDTPINTGNLPDQTDVQGWLERQRKTGLLPDGTPGPLDKPDYLRQSLLSNLAAERGTKVPRLPRGVQPGQRALTGGGVGAIAENLPQEAELPGFIRQLEERAGAVGASPVPTDDLGRRVMGMAVEKGATPTLAEIQAELKVGAVEAMRLQDVASGKSALPEVAPFRKPDDLLGTAAADTPSVVVNDGFSDRVTDKGHWRRGQKPTEPDAHPLDTLAGMQQAALQLRDELGRMPTPAEVRYRTGSGILQTQDIMDFLGGQGQGLAPHPDLDRMDALRGQEAVDNLSNLLMANYGSNSGKVLKNITGRGSFTSDGRLVGATGEDETRGLIEYLLHRGDMTEEERNAFQAQAFAAKRPDPAAVLETPPAGDLAGAAVPAAPPSLRDVALDPQFVGTELPGVNYFTKRTGLKPAEVKAGLDELAQAGDLAPLGDWYGRKPDGIQFQPTRLGVAASGGVLGGIAGGALADTTDADTKDDWGGRLGGVAAGAALGAGLASPGGARNLKFAGAVLRDAGSAELNAFAKGSTKPSWTGFSSAWSAQSVEHVRNLIEEPLSSLPMLLNEGGKIGDVVRYANDLKDLYTAGKRGAELYPTEVTDIAARMGFKQPLDLGTEGFKEAMGIGEQDLNPLVSALYGGALALTPSVNPVKALGIPFKMGLEALAPMRSTIHHALDNVSKISFRSAIAVPAFEDTAAQAAKLFEGEMTARVPGATLPSPDGMFTADELRQSLTNVPSGTRDLLANRWQAYVDATQQTGQQAAKDAFGNFSKFDPATASRGEKIAHGAEMGFRKVVPFSSWYLRAMPIAAKIAADHPAMTLAAAGLALDNALEAKREGLPGYMANKVPFDSNSPGIGKLVDVITPGKDAAHGLWNAAATLSPVRLEGVSGDSGEGDTTPYQQLQTWMGRAGFSFNPAIKALAYAMDWDYRRPGSLSRTADIEQALPGPTVANPAQSGLDLIRKGMGGSVSTTTPVDRRVAELIFQQTGKGINAPENAALAAATLDPNNPLVQQAQREVGEAGVAKNLVGLTVPGGVTGSTDLQLDIAKARQANPDAGKPPVRTPESVAADAVFQKNYPLQYALAQQAARQPGAPGAPDPLTQVYRGADTQGRAYQALAAWEDEHAADKFFRPTVYGAMKQELMRELGIAPY